MNGYGTGNKWKILPGYVAKRVIAILLAMLMAMPAGGLAAQTQQDKPVFSLGAKPIPDNLKASLPPAAVSPDFKSGGSVVDLTPLFPPIGYQGAIGSCTAWAVGYAIKGYHENRERRWGFSDRAHLFSASYVYNQINDGVDEGSSIDEAMALVKGQGVASYVTMPYTTDYRRQPNASARREAAKYPAETTRNIDLKQTAAVKAILAGGEPIAFGIPIYESFYNLSGSGVYATDRGANYGGHAMVIIGYDDNKRAYRIQNSWGTTWGDKGYAWIAYSYFESGKGYGLVMYDKVESTPVKPSAPSGINASQGVYSDQILVHWERSDTADSYKVLRATAAMGPWSVAGEVEGTNYVDRNVKEGTFYYYAIKAVTSLGESEASVVTQGFVAARTWVGIPQNLRASVDGSKVRLVWDAVPVAAGYHVFRFDGKKDFVQVGTSTDNGYLDSGLPNQDGVWYYSVTAFKGSQESYASDALAVTISVIRPVEDEEVIARPPARAQASQGNFADRVELEWESVPKIQAYVVQRFNKASNAWDVLGVSQRNTYTDRRPGSIRQYYRIISLVGEDAGMPGQSFYGYARSSPIRTKTFADDAYRDTLEQSQSRQLQDEKKFVSDTAYSEPPRTTNNFVKRDFFFVDVEKFFAVDPNFFKVPDNFFTDTQNFFGTR